MELNLTNKVAIVTGAAKGIGRVIALQLFNEGVKLALWDVNQFELEKLAQYINENGGEAIYNVCDVSDELQVERAMLQVIKSYTTVHILVANAGIAHFSKVIDMDVSLWDKVFDVNSKGVFICAKKVAPIMKKNNFGRIIIASSFAAIIPSVSSAAYAASKSAVVSLTRVLSAELGPWNITVNCYAPGMIPTDMSDIDNLSDERKEEMLDTLAIREWGRPEDIASLVVFLSSDQARYITGTLIDTSGGKYSVQFQKFARD
jgi:3-oxoacyl-[acyl-carrier protein] reductase